MKKGGAICRFNKRKGSSVIQEGSCCQIQTPRLVEAVRQVYASSYREIITAEVSGPELVDAKEVYTFKTAVGTKA
jgi:PRTRC genetic system protein C